MCRLAAYLGRSINLQRFLLEPAHSLIEQAWDPKETETARLNADGYGFGWYTAAGRSAVYTNPMPIWSDDNLPNLAHALHSRLWLAYVRSATPGQPVSQANTQPFADGTWLFIHNGRLENFTALLRPRLHRVLKPEIEAEIKGNTDSEYLFALLRQLRRHDHNDQPDVAIRRAFTDLAEWLDGHTALLNVIVSDGKRVYAARHAVGGSCPSLYYATDDAFYPGGCIIASERLTNSDAWHPVPEHHLMIFDPEQAPELIRL
ncbi:MAG: ergothioneine biosynthesis protein EgtC [Gammaproteobacteria bacterium]|nr:ergothioneine biosynthesis protein EgtC [Gammaproteobacteria bacterium]MCI0591729.1 ergothioneine biosynthesis protein EgtC [Gammaproteobacteria bacterium]